MPSPPPILVLFDLDGTLLDTQDAGIRAYEAAGEELLGRPFSYRDIPVHGRLDSENFRLGLDRHAPHLDGDEYEPAFKERYVRELNRIGAEFGGFEPLPGIVNLVDELAGRSDVELGILTGNWQQPGEMKLALGSLSPDRFEICAWAEDGACRNDLVPVASRRYIERHGVPPLLTLVIGDTPRDVECGLAHDAMTVGVATGVHSEADLISAGAHLVVRDFSDPLPLHEFLDHHSASPGG